MVSEDLNKESLESVKLVKKKRKKKKKTREEKLKSIETTVNDMKETVDFYCSRNLGICSSICEECILEILARKGYRLKKKEALESDLTLTKRLKGKSIWVGKILKNNSTEVKKGKITKITQEEVYFIFEEEGKEPVVGHLNKNRYKKINDFSDWFCLTEIELNDILEIFKKFKEIV